jgi:hypothetical protein
MKVYYDKDIVWELNKVIDDAMENKQTIAVIELDPIETQAFLEDVVALMGRGIVIKNFGCYIYRGVELKLNSEFK